MTRTTRSHSNDEPKYFSKHGIYHQNPNKTKKNGSGKLNWGKEGEELEDLIASGEISFFKRERRRSSNAQTSGIPSWDFRPNKEVGEFDDNEA